MPKTNRNTFPFRIPALLKGSLAAVAPAWLACSLLLALLPSISSSAADSTRTAPLKGTESPRVRGFKTFLPKPGSYSEEPQGRIIQLLLDRQDQGGRDSYLIQVLFRGKPAVERAHRVYPDRVEIDFFDIGKPAMRPVRIRGGAVEASYMEERHYQDGQAVRRMVRLTLFTRARPEIRFRNTLDRTLILFQIPFAPPPTAPNPSSKNDAGSVPGTKPR